MADAAPRSLIRLRRLALARARKELADCVQAEEEAARTVARAEALVERERQSALDLRADDLAVEAFAAWLVFGRRAVDQARTGLADAGGRTGKARAELAAARAALEAAEALVAARDAERARRMEHGAQRELEELARQKHEQRRRDFHS